MTATLRLVGQLKEYANGQSEVQVSSGLSVREALAGLGIPPEVVALVVVNEEQQTKDYILRDQDVVRVLAVIGGG
jgi:sulfur carrier protein ThiS